VQNSQTSRGGVDYDWNETVKFRFPLPLDTIHLNTGTGTGSNDKNSNNSNGSVSTQNNYLHKLYDCPDMISIDVFQKPAYSFAAAFGGLMTSTGAGVNENDKIGELQVPLGLFFAEKETQMQVQDPVGAGGDCGPNCFNSTPDLTHCDWYPLTHLSGSGGSGTVRNSDSVWLLHMEVNLRGCLMSCV